MLNKLLSTVSLAAVIAAPAMANTQSPLDISSPQTRQSTLAAPQYVGYEQGAEHKRFLESAEAEMAALHAEKASLPTQIKEQSKKMKAVGLTDDMVEMMNKSTFNDSFLGGLNSERMVKLATLSAEIYRVSKNPITTANRKELTQLDTDIKSKQDLKANLEELMQQADHELNKSDRKVKKFVRKLKRNYAIEIADNPADGLAPAIKRALTAKLHALNAELGTDLQQKAIYEQPWMTGVSQILRANPLLRGLQVVGVFLRNGKEFSGAAIYDETNNELFLSMAGSKSKLDWLRNFFGWNASSNRAHLNGIKFHAGFLSHFNSICDQSMAFANDWFESFKAKQDAGHVGKLKITGTGHSLGGAIAQILTGYLGATANKSFGIDAQAGGISFGAPNAIHSNSVDRYHDLIGGKANWVSVERSWDPVPKVCFWKQNPGVTIKAKQGLFYDAYGTMEIMGINPHGVSVYRDDAPVTFQRWKQELDKHRVLAAKYNQMQLRLAALPSLMSDLSARSTRAMSALLNKATPKKLNAYRSYTRKEQAKVDAQLQVVAQEAQAVQESSDRYHAVLRGGADLTMSMVADMVDDNVQDVLADNETKLRDLEEQRLRLQARKQEFAAKEEKSKGIFKSLLHGLLGLGKRQTVQAIPEAVAPNVSAAA